MPSTITHSFMAYDIYDKLNKNIKDRFKDKVSEYVTYSQGFDILFFYPIIPPFKKSMHIRKMAAYCHRNKVNKFFIYLVNDIKKDKNFDKFIFLSGLVTHYVGDTKCHPLVNYKHWDLEKKNNKKKDYHFVIEAYIDNYILNKNNYDYKKYKCYKLLNTKKNNKVSEMLDKAFLDVFKENNMGNKYYLSLKNMKLLFHLLRYDPYKFKRLGYSFINFFLRFLRRDIRYFSYNFDLNDSISAYYLNLNHSNWFNIKKRDKIYNKSFLDLYDEVVNKSVYMIEKLYDYIYNNKSIDLESLFGNLSYANGLSIINKKHTNS